MTARFEWLTVSFSALSPGFKVILVLREGCDIYPSDFSTFHFHHRPLSARASHFYDRTSNGNNSHLLLSLSTPLRTDIDFSFGTDHPNPNILPTYDTYAGGHSAPSAKLKTAGVYPRCAGGLYHTAQPAGDTYFLYFPCPCPCILMCVDISWWRPFGGF